MISLIFNIFILLRVNLEKLFFLLSKFLVLGGKFCMLVVVVVIFGWIWGIGF